VSDGMTALFVKPRPRGLGDCRKASQPSDRARTPAKAWRDRQHNASTKKQEQQDNSTGDTRAHVAAEEPAAAPQATAGPSLLQGVLVIPVGYLGLVLFFKAYKGSIWVSFSRCSGIVP
jgi:hypothetical protein